MGLTVRIAVAADAPVITEFNQRLALETEDKSLDSAVLTAGVDAVLADRARGVYFLAEEAGQVLGQLMITTEWSDWRNGWMWWIQSVYVRQQARRRGIFRTLYHHVEQAARTTPDVIGLRLYVEHENRKAQETYRSLGMVQTGYLLFERCPL
jgi:GNAT superfamily N-acetyltransferase